jgi:hypothetical protein
MFFNTKIISCYRDLPSLVNGENLFKDISTLKYVDYFNNDEESIHKGYGSLKTITDMFKGTKIESFYRDLPSLVKGDEMFCDLTTLTDVDGLNSL